MSFLFGVVTVCSVVGFVPHIPQKFTYVLLIVFALYNFWKPHKTSRWLLFFLLYIPTELLISQPDPLFKPWPRYAMFVLLLMCVSPLFQGEYHRNSRHHLMQMLLWTCVFLGVGSFFCWFLGINYMRIRNIDFINNVGMFGGLTPHSMLLGPISGIGAIFLSYLAMSSRKKWVWLLVILCLFSVMFSSSRIALAASLAGIAVTFYKLSGSFDKFFRISVITLLLAGSTLSFWGRAMDGMMKKNSDAISTIDMSSRSDKWGMRIEEFKSSPMFGIGFSSVDKVKAVEEYDASTGIIEPGTSWLTIFSMLGLAGAVIILPFFYRCYKILWHQTDAYHATILGILTLLYVHMLAEGYVLSGGSFMCFVLWLTVGVAYDSRNPS